MATKNLADFLKSIGFYFTGDVSETGISGDLEVAISYEKGSSVAAKEIEFKEGDGFSWGIAPWDDLLQVDIAQQAISEWKARVLYVNPVKPAEQMTTAQKQGQETYMRNLKAIMGETKFAAMIKEQEAAQARWQKAYEEQQKAERKAKEDMVNDPAQQLRVAQMVASPTLYPKLYGRIDSVQDIVIDTVPAGLFIKVPTLRSPTAMYADGKVITKEQYDSVVEPYMIKTKQYNATTYSDYGTKIAETHGFTFDGYHLANGWKLQKSKYEIIVDKKVNAKAEEEFIKDSESLKKLEVGTRVAIPILGSSGGLTQYYIAIDKTSSIKGFVLKADEVFVAESPSAYKTSKKSEPMYSLGGRTAIPKLKEPSFQTKMSFLFQYKDNFSFGSEEFPWMYISHEK